MLVAMCLFWVFGVVKLIEYIHSQWCLFELEATKLLEYIHSPLNPRGWPKGWPLSRFMRAVSPGGSQSPNFTGSERMERMRDAEAL